MGLKSRNKCWRDTLQLFGKPRATARGAQPRPKKGATSVGWSVFPWRCNPNIFFLRKHTHEQICTAYNIYIIYIYIYLSIYLYYISYIIRYNYIYTHMCVRISVHEYVRFNPSLGMWPCHPPAGSRTQGPAPGLRNDRWRIWNLTRALDVAHCGAGPAGTPGSHVWQVDSREKKVKVW